MKAIFTLFQLLLLCPALQANDVSRVLIVVGPSSHPPGSHEVAAGARLMKHCLEQTANVKGIKVDIVEGWPERPLREVTDTIVFIGDTFPPNRLPNANQNIADLEVMMARGCGIVCIHYATGLLGEDVSEEGDHPLLRWMGGYFANRSCPHHESFAKIFQQATITPASLQHPVSRGWQEFTLHDEPYYNNYFGPDNKIPANVVEFATSLLPPDNPTRQIVAWGVERSDGGRGFGVVMPHYYKNWAIEDLRRLILNGIVWTAKRDVPLMGVETELPDLETFRPDAVETTSSTPAVPAR